ncbi:HD domain-containing protein [Burkholderia territorii]|uniref:ATP-binding protein n=1 Tax=Burkholderia territorii TaxID=1503055 RepID=A0A6L3NL89_9BURK|nr:ATP-binding protein [Burkholderia territorii]KAB0685368.1 ATP-binding protein [Burkholderia territorii]MBM2771844.1 ATP-binding protein [Burkholderia territorii]VWB65362.1 Chaperone protein HtpG [Burkholderia territorii]
MAEENFKKTSLWKMSLAPVQDDPFEPQRTRLRAAYMACRDKVAPIVERIAHVLPGLTVHDISHLDALWETADIIAGSSYPLNPLEAFVFGLSILFHDSAMCWQAYELGRDGVRDSIEWKDAYAHECDAWPDMPDEMREKAADFSALRALHAHQAKNLPDLKWTHPDTSQEIYLIDDIQLRTEIGSLAGKIAASHHWDLAELTVALGDQFNAPFSLPAEWSVDPVKVACLLRCADAAHINQGRAPLFLYALIKRQGVSLDHWKAQNRMMGPSLDAGDPSRATVLYTSSRPFKEADAAAWWVAYDAVWVVAQEIDSSNELLRLRNRASSPEFAVKRVKGAASTVELTKYLRVEGWTPCNAKPHVSNVESLVKELGGEMLYGKGSPAHVLGITLREMIQNARDAIVARTFVDPGFEGEIVVSLSEINQEKWISVEDNGIGMSRAVMTGPLLDFGNSFWKSSLLQSEFPGLRSSAFRSIGRFGIGFYSVFMLGDSVEVASRGWDKGLDDANTLVFASGVSLRPILRHGRSRTLSSKTSTKVSVRINPKLLSTDSQIQVKPGYMGLQEFSCPLPDFIAALVIGLDVPVAVAVNDGQPSRVHAGSSVTTEAARQILSRNCFLAIRGDTAPKQYIDQNYHRMRPINVGERLIGFAALATTSNFGMMLLGRQTVGGMPTSLENGYSESFIGFMDCKPLSAKREASQFEASTETLRSWALEQLDILQNEGANDSERSVVAAHLGSFGCDPIDFARILISVEGVHAFVSFDQLAELAESKPVGILKSEIMQHADAYHSVQYVNGIALIRPVVNSQFCNLDFEGDEPKDKNSIIGCLFRAIVSRNKSPKWEVRETEYKSIFPGSLQLLSVTAT